MSVLLYVVGALAFAVGLVTAGYGFRLELSFGNTLLVIGTSAAIGGLIVIGLGGVVSQLRRVAEALAALAPMRPNRTSEIFQPPSVAATRVPFPARPKAGGMRPAEPGARPIAPPPAEMPAEEHFAAAPTLSNPEAPAMEVHEEVALSPSEPPPRPEPVVPPPPPRPLAETKLPPPPPRRPSPEAAPPTPPPPLPKEPPPRAAQKSRFDALWPAPAPAKPLAAESGEAEESSTPLAEPRRPAPAQQTEPEAPPRAGGEPVAILKSGVVDGMGYTLYVDGSIEAELPQGTLRFTSIEDLRRYLEKNS